MNDRIGSLLLLALLVLSLQRLLPLRQLLWPLLLLAEFSANKSDVEGDDFSLASALSKLVEADDGVEERCFLGGGTGGGVGEELRTALPPPALSPPTLNNSVSSRNRSVFSDDLRCFEVPHESAAVVGVVVAADEFLLDTFVVLGDDLRPKPKR